MVTIPAWEPMVCCTWHDQKQYWFVSYKEFIKWLARHVSMMDLIRDPIYLKDESGAAISPYTIRQDFSAYRATLREKRNRGNAPRLQGTKSHGYRYHRRIHTTPERRMNAGIVVDEGAILVRGRRRKLPNSWDDFCRTIDHNWKKHRKTQWK